MNALCRASCLCSRLKNQHLGSGCLGQPALFFGLIGSLAQSTFLEPTPWAHCTGNTLCNLCQGHLLCRNSKVWLSSISGSLQRGLFRCGTLLKIWSAACLWMRNFKGQKFQFVWEQVLRDQRLLGMMSYPPLQYGLEEELSMALVELDQVLYKWSLSLLKRHQWFQWSQYQRAWALGISSLCRQVIHLGVYGGRGSSAAHSSALVNTSFCHDEISSRVLLLRFVVVVCFFRSCLLPLDLLMWLLQFPCMLLLSGESVHCCVLPLEEHSLLMVKQMLMVDFSE